MATTRRPSRARPSSYKAAKARPAPARPSTPKPRAQGKPGAVSSEPTAFERALVAGAPTRHEIALRKKRRALQRSLQAEVIQLACRRMRSVLGPRGQGDDGVSTTGHMLAMIERLIEDRDYAAQLEVRARNAHAAIATVIAEIRALLGETGGTPNTLEIMLGLVRRLVAAFNARQPADDGGLDRLQLSQLETSAWFHQAPAKVTEAVEATLAAVRADPPKADFGPRCEEKDQCEDLDGSGACTGCGRWLAGGAKETSPAASDALNVGSAVAVGHPGALDACQDLGSGRCWICDRVMPEDREQSDNGIGIGSDGEYTTNGRKW